MRLIGLAAIALAAAVGYADALQKVKTQKGPRAVVEDTRSVFPQINETYSESPKRPANPSLPIIIGGANGLKAYSGKYGTTGHERGALFPGINATGWVPADPNIGVGPKYVVQVVNSSVAFFNKATGQKVFQQDIGRFGFFGGTGVTDFTYDAKVFYDQVEKRFYMVCLEVDDLNKASKFLVAVSDDSDPNGSWFKYRLDAKLTIDNNDYWLDYPGWGFNKDAIMVTGNMFPFADGNFGGAQFIVVPKASINSGGAPTLTSFRDADASSVQVAHTMDPTLDRIYAAALQTTSSIRVYAARNLLTTPEVVFTDVNTPAVNPNAVYAESKGGVQLDSLAFRLLNVMYRGKRLVTAHSVMVSDSDRRMMVRWYELDMKDWPTSGTPTTFQSGNITGAARQHFVMPAIAKNKFGDISVIFTRSSPDIAADVMIASRRQGDAPGVMGAPQQVVASPSTYYRGFNRWGDYFANVLDPDDDSTFWGVAMTIQPAYRWGTEITKWKVTDNGGGGTVFDPIAVKVIEGKATSGGLSDVLASDDRYLDILSSLDSQNKVGQLASAQYTFQLTKSASSILSLTLSVEAITNPDVAATGMVLLYNWNTKKYDNFANFALKPSGNGVNRGTVSTGIGNYVNSSKQVRAVFRGLVPVRRGGGLPQAYKLRTDQIQLSAQLKS